MPTPRVPGIPTTNNARKPKHTRLQVEPSVTASPSNSSRWSGRPQPPPSEPLPTTQPAKAVACTDLLCPCRQTSARKATVAGAVLARSRADPRRRLGKVGNLLLQPPPGGCRQQPFADHQGRRSCRVPQGDLREEKGGTLARPLRGPYRARIPPLTTWTTGE